MTAVLLAAGISSRMRPLTDSKPKSLLPVGGTPLLQRTLEALQRASIQRCIIVTGYLHEMLEHFIWSLNLELQITFVHNPLYSSTNNNYSLWLAKSALGNDSMLLLDADILFDHRILLNLRDSPCEDALVMRETREIGDEEVKVELDEWGRVINIGKDVRKEKTAGESLGIEKFSAATAQKLFKVLDRRKDFYEFYEASFQGMIQEGIDLHVVESGDLACMEIDTPEDYAAAQQLVTSLPQ